MGKSYNSMRDLLKSSHDSNEKLAAVSKMQVQLRAIAETEALEILAFRNVDKIINSYKEEENSGFDDVLLDAKQALPVILGIIPYLDPYNIPPSAKIDTYEYLKSLADTISDLKLSLSIYKKCVYIYMDSKDEDEARSKIKQLLNNNLDVINKVARNYPLEVSKLRSEAEAQASIILSERKYSLRTQAEIEAQSILNDRYLFFRTVAEADAQEIMSSRKEDKQIKANEKTEEKAHDSNIIIDIKQKEKAVETIKTKKVRSGCCGYGCLAFIISIILIIVFNDFFYSCFNKLTSFAVDNTGKFEMTSSGSKEIQEQLSVYYDDVFYDEEIGLYKLKKDEKWGLATVEGDVICKPKYDFIGPKINDDIIQVELDNKYGFITTMGGEVVKPQYSYIDTDNIDKEVQLVKIEKDGKYGFMSLKTYEEVSPCIYDYIHDFDGEHYEVDVDNKTGYLNRDGSVYKEAM